MEASLALIKLSLSFNEMQLWYDEENSSHKIDNLKIKLVNNESSRRILVNS